VEVPPSNFTILWAENRLIVCMAQGRENRTNEQQDEETAYFFWHGAPPDDMMIFKTFSILQKCL